MTNKHVAIFRKSGRFLFCFSFYCFSRLSFEFTKSFLMGNLVTKDAAAEDEKIANRDVDDRDFRISTSDDDDSVQNSSEKQSSDAIVLLENGGVEIKVVEPTEDQERATNSTRRRRTSEDDDNDDDEDEHVSRDVVIDENSDENAEDDEDDDGDSLTKERITSKNYADDEEDYQTFGARFGFSDDPFEDRAMEFMQTYEQNIYLMRRYQCQETMLVIAHESSPLVMFCRHVATLEKQLHRFVTSMNAATLPPESDDKTIQNHVPGILAQVMREVLHEPAQFVVGLQDGSITRIVENDGDPTLSHPDGVNLPVRVAPLAVVEPTDVNYEEKLALAQRLQSSSPHGNASFESIDAKHKTDHLRRFKQVGRRLPKNLQPSPGFTDFSPVQGIEDVWFVISLPYYVMWLAFERTCEGNGNMMMKLNSVLGSINESTYFFPIKMQNNEISYSAKQEHEVLRRAVEAYSTSLHFEAEIALLQSQAKNFAEVVCNRLDDRFIREITNAAGKEAKPELSSLVQQLSETAAVVKTLQERLKELDEKRGQRSFAMQ